MKSVFSIIEKAATSDAPIIVSEAGDRTITDECFDLLDQIAERRLKTSNPLQGKVGGIVVAGSELGQDNVAKDIMLILKTLWISFTAASVYLSHGS